MLEQACKAEQVFLKYHVKHHREINIRLIGIHKAGSEQQPSKSACHSSMYDTLLETGLCPYETGEEHLHRIHTIRTKKTLIWKIT